MLIASQLPVLKVNGCLHTINSVCRIRGESSKHVSPTLTQALGSDVWEETGSALLQVIHNLSTHTSPHKPLTGQCNSLSDQSTHQRLERGTYVSIRCGTLLQSQWLLSFVVVIFWLNHGMSRLWLWLPGSLTAKVYSYIFAVLLNAHFSTLIQIWRVRSWWLVTGS